MIPLFSLFNNYIVISAKCLGGTTINVYISYDDFCIGSALRPCLVPRNFQEYLSHRIFGRMYGALNIDKKNN